MSKRTILLEWGGSKVKETLWVFKDEGPYPVFKITQTWDGEKETVYLFFEELEEIVEAAQKYMEAHSD